MVKIDKHDFGFITIKGKKFQKDVMISWDGEVIEKEVSHVFSKNDLMELLHIKEPDIVIVGTGMTNKVKVDSTAYRFARSEGIKLIAKPTSEAVKEFNKQSHKKKVVGIIHVTD